jgi:hypothetical protein
MEANQRAFTFTTCLLDGCGKKMQKSWLKQHIMLRHTTYFRDLLANTGQRLIEGIPY